MAVAGGKTPERVAHRCGFGSANSLRAHMRTAFGVSPASYRRTFHTDDLVEAGV